MSRFDKVCKYSNNLTVSGDFGNDVNWVLWMFLHTKFHNTKGFIFNG